MHQLRRFFILVVAALAFFSANAEQNAEPAADWLIDAADKVCHGHYVIPKFDDSATSQGSTITADKTQLVPDGMSEVEGHVLLQQPGRRVFTDRAKLYRNASTGKINMAHLDGHVLLETPQYRLLGDSADINLTRQKAVINAAHFRIYPQRIRGHAKRSLNAANAQPISKTLFIPPALLVSTAGKYMQADYTLIMSPAKASPRGLVFK